MEDTKKKYRALPTLKKFHESSAPIRCIVGPVGSGKTTAATWEICYYLPMFLLDKYGLKSTRWVILRNTYSELIDTTQKTVFEWFDWGDYKVQQKDYRLKYPNGIDTEILFRSCDRPEDVKKFKSLEITGYWIDESIEIKDEIKLMLKNRIGRYPRKCPVRYGIETTNPPDIEHPTYYQFDFKTYVPGPLPERKEKWQSILEGHEGFWQPPNENIANLRKDYYVDLIKDYQNNLDWVARYIKGQPGITIVGKQVYNNFISRMHVSEDPLNWTGGKLYAGWDNTGNCPACVIAQIPTAGVLQILAEYHTERMGIVDFCDMVIMDRNQRWPDAEWKEWGDPAGEAKFSRTGGGLTSNAEMMQTSGIYLKPSEQNWEARRESVEFQLGRIIRGEPGVLIDPSCTRLINGFLGGYCYPEIGASGIYGDKPIKNKYSHVHDALQYMMVMLTKNIKRESRIGSKRPFRGFANWDNFLNDSQRKKKEYQEFYVR